MPILRRLKRSIIILFSYALLLGLKVAIGAVYLLYQTTRGLSRLFLGLSNATHKLHQTLQRLSIKQDIQSRLKRFGYY